MRLICAWCKLELQPDDGTGGHDSHGICPPCKDRVLADSNGDPLPPCKRCGANLDRENYSRLCSTCFRLPDEVAKRKEMSRAMLAILDATPNPDWRFAS